MALRPQIFVAALSLLLLGGCAAPPAAPDPPWEAALFVPVALPADAEDAPLASAQMRRHFEQHIAPRLGRGDPRQALHDALFGPGGLQMRYDASVTRTAAQAFEARAGNCLSLVLMTAAFAREAGLEVRVQSPRAAPDWSREGDTLLAVGHVNVGLRVPPSGGRRVAGHAGEWLVIDFLPGQRVVRRADEVVDDARLLAMFRNNRAAEALLAGRVDEAHAWARAAVAADRRFAAAYNTLGVLYLGRDAPRAAERVLRAALDIDPRSVNALANLVQALQRQGRADEAAVVTARLARLQPVAPLALYDRGRLAAAAGRLDEARHLFEAELRDGVDSPEVRLALAAVLAALGQPRAARAQLRFALEASPSDEQRARYAAKLERLDALSPPAQ